MRLALPHLRGYSPGGTSVTKGPFQLNHIIGYGQSLSIGERAYPVVSTVQPYSNVMLVDDGYDGADPPTTTTQGTLSLEPLIAPVRGGPLNAGTNEYPRNVFGESPEVGFANQLAASLGWTCVTSCCGASNESITALKKGGTGNGYAAILHEVTEIHALAVADGLSHGVVAVLLTHGESDALLADYTAEIAQLHNDLREDIRAITGQAGDIYLVISQQTAAPQTVGRPVSASTPLELYAALPRLVVFAPKHQYVYYPSEAHMYAHGYRRIGEGCAHAFMRKRLGLPFALRPTGVTVAGTTITINLEVPKGPLQWSTTVPDCHALTEEWAAGRGFEVEDAAGKITIESVTIDGSSVVLEIDRAPGYGGRISHAMYQDDTGYNAGETAGRHGQLCDSDPFESYSAASISCNVENGSDLIECVTTGAFDVRGEREIVTGSGLSGVVHVVDIDGDIIQLSTPWAGSTGTATLRFRNDHRNYLVAFSQPL